jgi:hypothetical protein
MSEQNAVVAKTDEQIIAESPFDSPIVVARNGVTEILTNFVGKRNDWKDRAYAAVQIKTETFKAGTSEHDSIVHDKSFLNSLVFIGKTNVERFLNTILRRIGQDNVEDAIPETGENAGVFQMGVFVKAWENLQAASLKLSELVEQYNEAVVKLQKAFPDFVAVMSNPNSTQEQKDKAVAHYNGLNEAVTTLKNEYEIRKAKRSKEAQAETVTPT